MEWMRPEEPKEWSTEVAKEANERSQATKSIVWNLDGVLREAGHRSPLGTSIKLGFAKPKPKDELKDASKKLCYYSSATEAGGSAHRMGKVYHPRAAL